MKLVNCMECNKEMNFIDATPCWNLQKAFDLTYLCDKCMVLKNSYQPERSKREDIDKEIICKKCKKPMEDATFLGMGVDKKCYNCHETWHHIRGYNLGY